MVLVQVTALETGLGQLLEQQGNDRKGEDRLLDLTSVTARRFHKPSLLLYETRSWLRRPRRHSVIGWPAEEGDSASKICLAQFLAPQPLQILASLFPSLNPASALDELIRRPLSEARRLRFHISILTPASVNAMLAMESAPPGRSCPVLPLPLIRCFFPFSSPFPICHPMLAHGFIAIRLFAAVFAAPVRSGRNRSGRLVPDCSAF